MTKKASNKKVISIRLGDLRNKEFQGLFDEILVQAKLITAEEVQKYITGFGNAVAELRDFLTVSTNESNEALASSINKERRLLYSRCRQVAKAAKDFPEASLNEITSKVWEVFRGSPISIRVSQVQATGTVNSVIEGLRAIGDESLTSCGIKIWADKLDAVNTRFKEVDSLRFSERGLRETERSLTLRGNCTDAFDLLVNCVLLRVAAGDEQCITFVKTVNEFFETRRSVLSSRRGRSKKAKDEKVAAKVAADAADVSAADTADATNASAAAPTAEVSVANAV